jgi:hypothetical protein
MKKKSSTHQKILEVKEQELQLVKMELEKCIQLNN